ncbi:PorT family protein [Myroides odoratimimus]|uniref:porin family protein n=1 Tax=Myroides odoratimimus TaxID=76832 RepID=UPI002098424C|nr:porin family protein [Myroides odoratimimus]MCO7721773.1 PorT family protein [Myroides odoratimimus]
MKKIIYTLVFSLGILTTTSAQNQEELKESDKNSFEKFFTENIDYQIRAHFSIGGSSPLGLPREIRKINSYNPGLQLGLEANATKWLTDDKQWGVRLGLRFEGKGMTTKANVKGYLTEIIQDNSKVRGYFTGDVKTKVRNTYLTVPVNVVYSINDNWNIYGGLYFSALIDKTFDGYVSNGHLRQTDPNGIKLTFEDDSSAPYDFSDEVRKFQWGTQVGAEWKMNNHFFLLGELSYGFNGVLNSDFDAISFSMHNIYLNLGFGYQF